MYHLDPEYERRMGDFDDVEDMCNQLGLNYDEVYDYEDKYRDDDDDDAYNNGYDDNNDDDDD